jgi:CBS domain-containing protein
MKVKEIMSSEVVTVSPSSLTQEAAQLMSIHHIGMLPVLDGDTVAGVVTDRDITIRAAARGWSPMLTQVREIMSTGIVWCFEEASAEEAARLMVKKQVHRLLVFNREIYCTGVVSLDDVAVALRDETMLGRFARDIACPVVAYRAVA